jgi:hypothetical protein
MSVLCFSVNYTLELLTTVTRWGNNPHLTKTMLLMGRDNLQAGIEVPNFEGKCSVHPTRSFYKKNGSSWFLRNKNTYLSSDNTWHVTRHKSVIFAAGTTDAWWQLSVCRVCTRLSPLPVHGRRQYSSCRFLFTLICVSIVSYIQLKTFHLPTRNSVRYCSSHTPVH